LHFWCASSCLEHATREVLYMKQICGMKNSSGAAE
jgi:hypothetical protein